MQYTPALSNQSCCRQRHHQQLQRCLQAQEVGMYVCSCSICLQQGPPWSPTCAGNKLRRHTFHNLSTASDVTRMQASLPWGQRCLGRAMSACCAFCSSCWRQERAGLSMWRPLRAPGLRSSLGTWPLSLRCSSHAQCTWASWANAAQTSCAPAMSAPYAAVPCILDLH